MKFNLIDIGKRIVKVREEKHLSQFDLAEEMGLSTSQLSKIENGNANFTLVTLEAICSTLEITPDELLLGSCNSTGTDFFDNLKAKLKICNPNDYDTIMGIINVFSEKR